MTAIKFEKENMKEILMFIFGFCIMVITCFGGIAYSQGKRKEAQFKEESVHFANWGN